MKVFRRFSSKPFSVNLELRLNILISPQSTKIQTFYPRFSNRTNLSQLYEQSLRRLPHKHTSHYTRCTCMSPILVMIFKQPHSQTGLSKDMWLLSDETHWLRWCYIEQTQAQPQFRSKTRNHLYAIWTAKRTQSTICIQRTGNRPTNQPTRRIWSGKLWPFFAWLSNHIQTHTHLSF